MRPPSTAVALLLLIGISGAVTAQGTSVDGILSAQLEAILDVHASLLTAIINDDATPANLDRLRARLCHEAAEFRGIVQVFQTTPTRHDLDTAHHLMRESVISLNEQREILVAIRGDGEPSPDLTQADVDDVWEMAEAILIERLEEEVTEFLEEEGLLDLVSDIGFAEARDAITQQVGHGLKEVLADELYSIVGFNVLDRGALRQVLHMRANSAARGIVGRLLMKFTGNALVIQFGTDIIINWIGPKLQELFRHRGHTRERLQRTIVGFGNRWDDLNGLPADAPIKQVLARVEAAERAIDATRYLKGDLRRAGDDEGGDILVVGIDQLQTKIDETVRYYVLDQNAHADDYAAIVSVLTDISRDIGCGSTTGGATVADTPPFPVDDTRYQEHSFKKPLYLVHITVTYTADGAKNGDQWVLYHVPPKESGRFTMGDGGGAGTMSYETDKHFGPFSGASDICPVMKGLGLTSVRAYTGFFTCKQLD